MSLEDDLLALDRLFWEGGPEVYEAHSDTECLVVFADRAGIMPRDEIAKSAEARRWRDVEMTPKGFRQLSEGSAMIAYACRARRKDGGFYEALVGSGYVRRDDGWKLAFHQQTEVSQKA